MTDNNRNYRGIRLEEKLHGQPGIYRLRVWNADKGMYVNPQTLPESHQKPYRAKRRVRVLGVSRLQSACFDTVEEARQWRMSRPDGNSRPTNSPYSIHELIADWREFHRPPRIRESTWEMYGKDVRHFDFLEKIPVEKLRPQDIDEWLVQVKSPDYPKRKARTSYKREVETLAKMLAWYREYKYRYDYRSPVLPRHKKDSVFRTKPLVVKKALTWEELERFLTRLRSNHKPVYYHLAEFQVLTGARIGEACGLQWQDVDLDHRTVTIRRTIWWDHKSRRPHVSETTKTDQSREIVLCERLVEVLKEWRQLCGSDSLVFHRNGEPLHYTAIQSAYNKVFEALGLPVRSTHTLRHTFATLFTEQTRNRMATQGVLGHTSSNMTDRYARPTLKAQRDSMEDFLVGKVRPALESRM